MTIRNSTDTPYTEMTRHTELCRSIKYNSTFHSEAFIDCTLILVVKWQIAARFYRALESVSIAPALSSALTIYLCQIRVHQTLTVLNSNFSQLGRRSGGQSQLTVCPRRLPVNTVIHTALAGIEPKHNLPIVSPTRYHAVGLPRPPFVACAAFVIC